MNWKVVLTVPYPGIPCNEAGYKELGAELVKAACITEDDLIAAGRDTDALISTGVLPLTSRVISSLNRCRLISCIGVGVDGVDLSAATEHGICVTNVPDYCVEEMSDHAMALILACARKLVRLDMAVREGKWDSAVSKAAIREVCRPMFPVRGQTLGLVGFGRTARAIVPKARGFGLKIIAFDPYVPVEAAREMGVDMVEFDRVIRESDFVSLHSALTAESRNLIGMEQFRMMKPTAYLINIARGGLVDEDALYTALSQGIIAGAGLDAFEPEPLSVNSPLMKLDNVIFTPHTANYSDQSILELKKRPEEQVFRVLRGEWPTDLLNPKVKDRFLARWRTSR